jgi:hypothetical protein
MFQQLACTSRTITRVHESLGPRETPAMALGFTDYAWSIGELVTACLENAPRDLLRFMVRVASFPGLIPYRHVNRTLLYN